MRTVQYGENEGKFFKNDRARVRAAFKSFSEKTLSALTARSTGAFAHVRTLGGWYA